MRNLKFKNRLRRNWMIRKFDEADAFARCLNCSGKFPSPRIHIRLEVAGRTSIEVVGNVIPYCNFEERSGQFDATVRRDPSCKPDGLQSFAAAEICNGVMVANPLLNDKPSPSASNSAATATSFR